MTWLDSGHPNTHSHQTSNCHMAGLNSQVLHAHSKSSFPVYLTAIALEEEALREMGLIGESMDSIKTLQIRSTLSQAATLG